MQGLGRIFWWRQRLHNACAAVEAVLLIVSTQTGRTRRKNAAADEARKGEAWLLGFLAVADVAMVNACNPFTCSSRRVLTSSVKVNDCFAFDVVRFVEQNMQPLLQPQPLLRKARQRPIPSKSQFSQGAALWVVCDRVEVCIDPRQVHVVRSND
jgi:hypothetical protein